jgi:hypothetical protein
MGKLTFRRVAHTLKRRCIIATLPIVGGLLFLGGSFCFWPHSPRQTINAGAICFLVGSLCYWVAPFLDYWELRLNYSNLLDPPPAMVKDLASNYEANDTLRVAALYEHLYKSHLLRIQCANCYIYMAGGAFFVGGSTLFFPAMAEIIYHGGWLYITGCVLTLSGALLAMFTASEMKRTSLPTQFVTTPPFYYLPRCSDEEATVLSCWFYVGGNVVFIVGSIFFFPRIIEAAGDSVEYLAVVLFLLGSVLFIAGAAIDLVVLARADFIISPANTPQLARQLALAHRLAGDSEDRQASSPEATTTGAPNGFGGSTVGITELTTMDNSADASTTNAAASATQPTVPYPSASPAPLESEDRGGPSVPRHFHVEETAVKVNMEGEYTAGLPDIEASTSAPGE